MRESVDESVTEPTDLELVDAAQKGDRQAYGALVDRHFKSVYSVAMRILGNSADAEDVSQDTFIRAFERLELFDRQWSFRNWLLKISSNLAINRIRSRGREHRLQLKMAEAGEPITESEQTEAPAPKSGHIGLTRSTRHSGQPLCCSTFKTCPTPRSQKY